MPKKDTKKIVDELMGLLHGYSTTFRKITTKERYDALITSGIIKDYNYDTQAIREPLIEHVGHLPTIASHLHQYIEHKNKIDLGRVLIMLSVHDVGETKVGDVLAYAKSDAHEEAERVAARGLLPDHLYEYFIEYERAQSFDARFAKAVDSIAPFLHEIAIPEVTRERFKYFNFGVEDIIKKKKKHFEWDDVFLGIFDYCITEFRKIEKGK